MLRKLLFRPEKFPEEIRGFIVCSLVHDKIEFQREERKQAVSYSTLESTGHFVWDPGPRAMSVKQTG